MPSISDGGFKLYKFGPCCPKENSEEQTRIIIRNRPLRPLNFFCVEDDGLLLALGHHIQGAMSDAIEQSQLGDSAERRKSTPLPLLQIFIAYLIQFAEPITALVIYPFVNQFVRDTGITKGDETKTGYYAGVIVCLVL